MDLTTVLLNCQNADITIRQNAEQALIAAEQNLGEFMVQLATQLSTEGVDLNARQLAGLYLKNFFSARDSNILADKLNKWHAMNSEFKEQVKTLLLQSLRSPHAIARHTAAQAAAQIAIIDIPSKEWSNLLPTLLQYSTTEDNDGIKVASLETLGYICEELSDEYVDQSEINQILTAIVDGAAPTRSKEVVYAAITALRNSLDFASTNFEQEAERNVLMEVICNSTQHSDQQTRQTAFECLVMVAMLYYDKLETYMQTLFTLTLNAIQNDHEDVSKEALEFWSTLAEEELEILEEEPETATRTCIRYVEGALPHLVPCALQTLLKQNEESEDDDWNISKAGATCLRLVGQVTKDACVPYILPFIEQNIQGTNWRQREASVMAFAAFLEGPNHDSMTQIITQALPTFIGFLDDNHHLVKDSTTWLIAQIAEHYSTVVTGEAFQHLLNALVKLLNDVPRVASQACFAIHNMASVYANVDDNSTNPFSSVFGALVQKLLETADREDSMEHYLQASAYETINMLIESSAQDVRPIVASLLPVILQRLNASFGSSLEEKDGTQNLQTLLCGTIYASIKVLESDIEQMADPIMQLMLTILQRSQSAAHEDALLVVSLVAEHTKTNFSKYMDALMPFLLRELGNSIASQVCIVALDVVGELSRNLEKQLVPYCNSLFEVLFRDLQNPDLHRDVKPHIFSTFGDIAMAIGGDYQPYLEYSMGFMVEASQAAIAIAQQINEGNDDETIFEYLKQLRESILEGYTGIIQGIREQKPHLITKYQEQIFIFIASIAQDSNRDEELVNSCIGLFGDMIQAIGSPILPYTQQPFVGILMQDAMQSSDEAQRTAEWVTSLIRDLR